MVCRGRPGQDIYSDVSRCGTNHQKTERPLIFGPKYVTAMAGLTKERAVHFKVPTGHVDKCKLGMRKTQRAKKEGMPIVMNDGRQYDADMSRVAARQRAIELAIVIDEDFHELGLPRYPGKTASLNDDRRPPLYWVRKMTLTAVVTF